MSDNRGFDYFNGKSSLLWLQMLLLGELVHSIDRLSIHWLLYLRCSSCIYAVGTSFPKYTDVLSTTFQTKQKRNVA